MRKKGKDEGPWVQAKHLTQDQYAMNHPAGRIGRRLTLRVADVMLSGRSFMPLVRPSACLNQSTTHFQHSAGCLQGFAGFCLSMTPYPWLFLTDWASACLPPDKVLEGWSTATGVR